MACTVADIISILSQWAPEETAEDWDRVGLQIGDPTQQVQRVLVALDATPDVARQAAQRGAQLVISHHPRMFSPLQTLVQQDPQAAAAMAFVKEGLSLYVMHTNLDRASGGVNDVLAQTVGLVQPLAIDQGLARLGQLHPPMTLGAWAHCAGERLGSLTWIAGDASALIEKAAVAAGAGGNAIKVAADLGAQALLTGEVKHHEALLAQQLGIGLVMTGHDTSEWPIIPRIVDYLQTRLAALQLIHSIEVMQAVGCTPIWSSPTKE